jgi:hypothetical protein
VTNVLEEVDTRYFGKSLKLVSDQVAGGVRKPRVILIQTGILFLVSRFRL